MAVVILSVAFTGVGVWAGAMWPQLDEARGGSPDVMAMYVVSLGCLVLSALLLGPPGFYLGGDPAGVLDSGVPNGALALLASLGIAIIILIWGIMRGAKRYAVLEGAH